MYYVYELTESVLMYAITTKPHEEDHEHYTVILRCECAELYEAVQDISGGTDDIAWNAAHVPVPTSTLPEAFQDGTVLAYSHFHDIRMEVTKKYDDRIDELEAELAATQAKLAAIKAIMAA